jgi:hypothetical protein
MGVGAVSIDAGVVGSTTRVGFDTVVADVLDVSVVSVALG